MALELRRRKFSVDEYEQMGRAGILGEDDRVELIDGEIVEMTPIGHRHADCVNRLTRHFLLLFDDVAVVSVQNPVRAGDWSQPQPDLALIRRRTGLYASGHPQPQDTILIVEVADSSIETDRRIKTPLYARNGFHEVWIVDLAQGVITGYQDPTPDGYRTVRVLRRGDEVAITAFPDRILAVSDLLPE